MTAQHRAPADPVSPDAAAPAPARRRPPGWDPAVLTAIAAGGVVGAEARYGLGVLLPHEPGQWPWATWLINVSGCFLIGILMVVITELTSPHRLVRPFLGVGVLGGYTTFSTAMVDVQQLAVTGHPGAALGYLAGTVTAAVAATFVGMALTRAAAVVWPRRRARRSERA
ncbi:fluoride efflux transporter FluC [Geodermatophilus ruber]|uniref:Fluoride-specific ion channel FluC n=1 Tax=Geodermatophilus ruber TaxID=504800 RepID=A0A1I4G009_9ACTN|nr:CrcB family protein [Geodermatophilus ruber]SFL22321.1 CrcB protein [Geodermatophilus ruber]